MSEAEVRRTSPAELSDLPANFWDEAELVAPTPKRAISLRLDEDVLDWFRRSGPRYQTRMNAVLRMYVRRTTEVSMKAVNRESRIDGELRFAIANNRLIEFSYHGVRRVAEPHDYGMQNGTAKLLVYQRTSTGGGASGRTVRGWRLLEVGKMMEFSILDATFPGSRGEAHHRHYSWQVVFARVS